MMKEKTRQEHDYRTLPIATAVVKSTFTDEELRDEELVREVLEGRLSLESRLENIPKFNYRFQRFQSGSRYEGASIEELRRIWKEGEKETEIQVQEGLFSRIRNGYKEVFEGLFFDTEEEVVIHEELPLEEKIENAIGDLREKRRQDKQSLREMRRAQQHLSEYVSELETRHRQDERAYTKLSRFGKNLKDEIVDLEMKLEQPVGPSEESKYRQQLERGQAYFLRLFEQLEYLRDEIEVLSKARSRYGKMEMKIERMVQSQERRSRNALRMITEAEVTRDLGSVIEAADYFNELDQSLEEMAEVQREAYEVLDSTLEAVDDIMDKSYDHSMPEESVETYRSNLFREKAKKFDDMLSQGLPA